MSFRARLLVCSLFLLGAAGCSEAETPNAGFDGGAPVTPAFDGGPGFGSRDEPCASGNRCESSALVCVIEAVAGGGSTSTCRLLCDRAATDDPCGAASTCGRLEDDRGACLPAGGLDEDCPCDDGFACTLLSVGDAGQSGICKRTCDLPDDDGGAVDPCPTDESCRRLQGSDDLGVCIED